MTDCTKIINDISRNCKLTNAQYANDGPDHKAGETRTDGRYPIRIGSTYTCLSFVGIGRRLMQKEQTQYWRNHPDKFMQDMYGIKLKWYQRILLHYMNR